VNSQAFEYYNKLADVEGKPRLRRADADELNEVVGWTALVDKANEELSKMEKELVPLSKVTNLDTLQVVLHAQGPNRLNKERTAFEKAAVNLATLHETQFKASLKYANRVAALESQSDSGKNSRRVAARNAADLKHLAGIPQEYNIKLTVWYH
jgi:hypothetical protein